MIPTSQEKRLKIVSNYYAFITRRTSSSNFSNAERFFCKQLKFLADNVGAIHMGRYDDDAFISATSSLLRRKENPTTLLSFHSKTTCVWNESNLRLKTLSGRLPSMNPVEIEDVCIFNRMYPSVHTIF